MEDINKTKELIDKEVSNGKISFTGAPFAKHQVVYFTSNENVKESVDNLCLGNNYNSALTVLASGDQLFEYISHGILNVDTFDKNRLTEYYVFGLKRAMICKYSYEEYLNAIKTILNCFSSFDDVNNVVYDVLPYMDNKYQMFWKEILDYSIKIQKGSNKKYDIFKILFIHFSKDYLYEQKYSYLKNKESYNAFKSNLLRANLSFKEANAINLKKEFNKTYDSIYLSNILDYFYYDLGYEWDNFYLENYKNDLLDITNNNGSILLHYIFNYYCNNVESYNLINNCKVSYNYLSKFNIYKVPRVCEGKKIGDGNIIIRKK